MCQPLALKLGPNPTISVVEFIRFCRFNLFRQLFNFFSNCFRPRKNLCFPVAVFESSSRNLREQGGTLPESCGPERSKAPP
jgi:hypothetical protein